MKLFTYDAVSSLPAALAARRGTFFAGGTTLVDLMKLEVLTPERLVDIGSLPLTKIEATPARLRIEALARMADVAASHDVLRNYPVVAQALLRSASPQIRNMATIGGNLMQRTRCSYFRSVAEPCNKRVPGSGCGAFEGDNRSHALFGGGPACVATHASDLAVALVALDATLTLTSAKGSRDVPLAEFYLLPGSSPSTENVLAPGELITAVNATGGPRAARSLYVKVRDRASFEFALVSVAAALALEGGMVKDVRLAAGGVGTKPWRLAAAESALRGQPATLAAFEGAAKRSLEGAMPLSGNGFKTSLLERTVVKTLARLGGVS
ncbi:MAG: xanthine dehydrogenase family protein subunit M [Acidobacteria bacterium]|nr:xanthine dehydrogenase family protein subunit M [Acidobacteriota bacterium]